VKVTKDRLFLLCTNLAKLVACYDVTVVVLASLLFTWRRWLW